jgi:hypothetical protein
MAAGLSNVCVEIDGEGKIVITAHRDDNGTEKAYTNEPNEWDEVLNRRS